MIKLLEYKSKQNGAEFVPTPEMIAFADVYVESRRNISAACAAAGDISRNIYYSRPNGWRWNTAFMVWLNNYCKKWVLSNVGDWYLIALRHAEKGSFSHLEMLMQLAEEFVKTPGDTHVHVYPSGKVLVFQDIKEGSNASDNGKADNLHAAQGTGSNRL